MGSLGTHSVTRQLAKSILTKLEKECSDERCDTCPMRGDCNIGEIRDYIDTLIYGSKT